MPSPGFFLQFIQNSAIHSERRFCTRRTTFSYGTKALNSQRLLKIYKLTSVVDSIDLSTTRKHLYQKKSLFSHIKHGKLRNLSLISQTSFTYVSYDCSLQRHKHHSAFQNAKDCQTASNPSKLC